MSLQGHLSSLHLPVWALVLWVIVLGSAVPFALIVGAMRHITATQVGVTAMLEPVVATVAAWLWLRESLSATQLAGAAVVLCGIAPGADGQITRSRRRKAPFVYSACIKERSSESFSPRSSSRSPRSMRSRSSRTSGARSSGLNGFVT